MLNAFFLSWALSKNASYSKFPFLISITDSQQVNKTFLNCSTRKSNKVPTTIRTVKRKLQSKKLDCAISYSTGRVHHYQLQCAHRRVDHFRTLQCDISRKRKLRRWGENALDLWHLRFERIESTHKHTHKHCQFWNSIFSLLHLLCEPADNLNRCDRNFNSPWVLKCFHNSSNRWWNFNSSSNIIQQCQLSPALESLSTVQSVSSLIRAIVSNYYRKQSYIRRMAYSSHSRRWHSRTFSRNIRTNSRQMLRQIFNFDRYQRQQSFHQTIPLRRLHRSSPRRRASSHRHFRFSNPTLPVVSIEISPVSRCHTIRHSRALEPPVIRQRQPFRWE